MILEPRVRLGITFRVVQYKNKNKRSLWRMVIDTKFFFFFNDYKSETNNNSDFKITK